MVLNHLTPCQQISIIQPRWKDRTILIAKFKVRTHNAIRFTKAPTYPDEYYLSGKTIMNSPLDTNGKIACYAVSLDELEQLERA